MPPSAEMLVAVKAFASQMLLVALTAALDAGAESANQPLVALYMSAFLTDLRSAIDPDGTGISRTTSFALSQCSASS